jgi:hypothetical protein
VLVPAFVFSSSSFIHRVGLRIRDRDGWALPGMHFDPA